MTTFASLQRPVRAYAAQRPVIESVRKALLRQLTIVLHGYRKPGERPQDYKVNPYGLILYQYGLYLIGYSHHAAALRMFALERVKTITVTEDMFDLPSSVSLADRLDRAFGLIEESPQDVKIWIAPEWAYFVQERSWHPTQRIKLQKDGSVILDHAVRRSRRTDRLGSFFWPWGQSTRPAIPDRPGLQPTDNRRPIISIPPLALSNAQ